MLSEISWEQFQEWIDYAAVEPFGEERGDLRIGILTATLVNLISGAFGSKGKPAKADDFMPKFADDGPKQYTAAEWDEVKANFMAYAKGN